MAEIEFQEVKHRVKKYLSQLGLSRSSAIDLVLSSIVINLFTLTLPLIMMQIYDRILLNSSMGTLAWITIAGVTAMFLESIVRYCRSAVSQIHAARYEHRSTCEMVQKLLKGKTEDLEQNETEDYLKSIDSIKTLKQFYSGQAFQTLLDLPFAFLFFLTILYIGGTIVIFPVVIAIAFVFLTKKIIEKYEDSLEDCNEIEEHRHKYLVNLLNGLPSVKSFTNEEHMLRRFEAHQYKNTHLYHKKIFWKNAPTQLGTFFSQLAMFGIILIGGGKVLNNTLSLGGLTACMLLSSRAISPIQNAAKFFMQYGEVKLLKKKLALIKNIKVHGSGKARMPSDLLGRIDIKGVHYRYSLAHPFILEDASLIIPEKKMVGISSASLAGTSTLLYLMMGKLTPEKGKIYVSGIDISSRDHESLAQHIKYLPRHPVLFKGTILDNVTFHNSHLRPAALETCTMLGLDPLVATLPYGYETAVDDRHSRHLPSSLVHRVAIARVLLKRPRVLLVDKTSSSMDSDTEKYFLELLHQIKPYCTVVIVSQWNNLLSRCDKVYELEYKQLTEIDPSSLVQPKKSYA